MNAAAEVAQGDVVKARDQQKVHDDAPQPEHDDVRTDPGIEGDRHPGSNLDDTDHEQEGVGAEGQDLRDQRREVLVPVDKLTLNNQQIQKEAGFRYGLG